MKFRMSERMRGVLCLIGQSVVFEEGCELIKELLGIETSAPQIQRVCEYFGRSIDGLIRSNCKHVLPQLEASHSEDNTYIMVDGSMIFTREDKWREVKLGRVFHQSQVIDIQKNRKEILESIYVSHLGSADDFFPKFERFLVPYENKIILGDGASWIWRWAEDNYPGATHILDYYHAKEKLTLFAKHQYSDERKRAKWVDKQAQSLLENKLEEVLTEVQSCRTRNEEAKMAKMKLIRYYIENDDRMQYGTYLEKGYMIGSGPIEAAHRSVIQQRMKLSGQKWSIKGANAMANLRCYRQSGAWNAVKTVIAAAA